MTKESHDEDTDGTKNNTSPTGGERYNCYCISRGVTLALLVNPSVGQEV